MSELVDFLEFDEARLIRSRLADDGITFPSLKDLIEKSERARPEFFNFFSFHGKVVFVKARFVGRRRFWQLFCRNFSPVELFGISVLSYSRHQDTWLCFEIEDFDFIMAKFNLFCRGLLDRG